MKQPSMQGIISELQSERLDLMFFFRLELNNASGADLDMRWHVNGTTEVHNKALDRIEQVGVMNWLGAKHDFVLADITGIKLSDGGQVNSPKLRVSNVVGGVAGFLTALCLTHRNLVGAKLTIDITSRMSFKAGTGQYKRQLWWIDRLSGLYPDFGEFELKSPLDFRRQVVPTRLVSPYCTWAMRQQYRGETCGYTGNKYFDKQGKPVDTIAKDQCGGCLSDCIARFGKGSVLPHGGFMVFFRNGNA